jgi:hypothetical protein
MLVYKYLDPKRIDDVLKNSHIRFTQPAALNDPFEVRPNLREMLRYYPEEAHQAIKDFFGRWNEDNASDLAFLSLSKNRNNLLMWSHYCDSHRGFIVGFDSTDPFFSVPKPWG